MADPPIPLPFLCFRLRSLIGQSSRAPIPATIGIGASCLGSRADEISRGAHLHLIPLYQWSIEAACTAGKLSRRDYAQARRVTTTPPYHAIMLLDLTDDELVAHLRHALEYDPFPYARGSTR